MKYHIFSIGDYHNALTIEKVKGDKYIKLQINNETVLLEIDKFKSEMVNYLKLLEKK